MSEIRKPELTEAISSLAGPFAQVSSDATRRLCEQGQFVAKTIGEWNTEVSHFVSHRVARNGEALGRMTKCQNLPEVFAMQAQWVRDAADDYLREMSKLMEINSGLMSGMLGSRGQVGMSSAVEMPTSPVAHPASETPASREVRLGPETRFQPATRPSPARSTAKAED
jgi:Phasin protein